MTVLLTILTGVSVFVIGQIVVKLIIDPVHELKRTIADISNSLIELAPIYFNPGIVSDEEAHRAHRELRSLSSKLSAQLYLIPKYSWTAKVFGLPPFKDVTEAASQLIGLSNSVFRSTAQHLGRKNPEKAQFICRRLGIYIPEKERLTED